MSKLKEKLMLSEKGYSDLKKAITACTITNIALLLPSMVACLLFWELLKPVYRRNNFVGRTVEAAGLGSDCGYPSISGREKRLQENLYCLL